MTAQPIEAEPLPAAPPPSDEEAGTDRITVSLPIGLSRRLRAVAAAEHTTVSAVVARAVRHEILLQKMGEYLDQYEAEFGKITEEEMARVRTDLDRRSTQFPRESRS